MALRPQLLRGLPVEERPSLEDCRRRCCESSLPDSPLSAESLSFELRVLPSAKESHAADRRRLAALPFQASLWGAARLPKSNAPPNAEKKTRESKMPQSAAAWTLSRMRELDAGHCTCTTTRRAVCVSGAGLLRNERGSASDGLEL